MDKLTELEKAGIAAIQKLQSFANIDESDEDVLACWRSMRRHEQKFTLELSGLDNDTLTRLVSTMMED